MGRSSDRDRVEPSARQQRQAAVGAAPQNQGQRSRPEPRGGPLRTLVEDCEYRCLGQPRDVDDQRVEARPALDHKDLSNGAVVGRIRTEPINGLGREGDEPARAQQPGSLGDRLGGGGYDQDWLREQLFASFRILDKDRADWAVLRRFEDLLDSVAGRIDRFRLPVVVEAKYLWG